MILDDRRFGRRAKQIVYDAADCAHRLGHQSVSPGHLLLAMLDEQFGDTTEIEHLLGAPAERMAAAMKEALGTGATRREGYLPLDAETKSVLELATHKAVGLGATTVEPPHLLLALISQGSGTVVDVLHSNGVDLDHRRQLIERPAPSRTILDNVTRDLTGQTGPAIGRSREIDRVVQVLTRHHRKVPLLIGDPGVGKHAVAAGVARAIAQEHVPDPLRGRTVRALDLGAVLADPQHRARGGALIAELLTEVRDNTHLVLFLNGALTPLYLPDRTTTPLGLFRPLLDAPRVFVFGDCGRSEYERRDPNTGLDRLIQPVLIEEPSAEGVREILRTERRRLEIHHNVTFTDDALAAAASLAHDHVPDQSLPGAAIDLLDEAGALARIRAARSDAPPDQSLEVTGADVSQALAAYSGIQTPPRRLTTPAEHDPSVWSMS
ncbi:Clp protease N-terminal domain-containing protein [Streptomyces sp. NPDC001177]